MKVAVMTDSTAYIPEDIRKKNNIHMVPLSVVFGGVSYREEIDLSTEEFYNKMREAEGLPTTSQPSIGTIKEKLEELAMNYDVVISIHLSRKISGTYDAVISAGEMVQGIELFAFDSECSCMAQGFYVLKAVEMTSQGESLEQVMQHLETMKENMQAYFMVDDLTNLKKGGRLSSTQALIGGLLKIKPILHLVDGSIVPFEKIRTRKKAIHRIMGMLEADAAQDVIEKVVFIHGNNEQAALELQENFQKKYPTIKSSISYFGPVIGTHLGENAIGASWYTR